MPSLTSPVPALSLRGVRVEYAETPALRGVDFDAAAGTLTVIAGPNGAGKSTLLEVLAGTVTPRAGSVTVRADSRAFVPQRQAISPTLPLTVRDVVSVGAWGGVPPWRRLDRVSREAVDAALDRMDLTALQRSPFRALSGGQQQRTLLAQGLARRADVLLLDEPTAALDDESAKRIVGAMAAEVARGATVVCVSHDQAVMDAAARVVRLDQGRIASVTHVEKSRG
ncbi:zinc ABC transporter ATP-binding protein AztA [Microbacterium timonense]|uniref:zinc ABC transporter ATP-binding protein AztA n=1 Tax=Microbacterium timonense TaxID=2086576 RepID=UPI000D0E909A|nr:zinc ABC transporter ATP-binding protein AztA [Microbacterium timonense]